MEFPLWMRTLRLTVTNQSETKTFWTALGSTVAEVPNGEHGVVMMNVNARTGRRGEGCVDYNVLGVYMRDALNGNGRRLLTFSVETNSLSLTRVSVHPSVESYALSNV